MTGEPFLLVRYGEIGLKGRNRPYFLDRLARNLAAQAGRDLEIRPHFGRILVRLPAEDPALVGALARVFGVVSVSPAVRIPSRIDAIIEAADAVTARALSRRPAVTFKADTRRADKRFPLSSTEVNVQVGAHLEQRYGLRVNLTAPDLTVSVEIREMTYVYTEVLPGPGGLPVGTGGRAVALLSGGIDSPVAVWMAAKRGAVVIPVHCHAFPFVSERSRLKVEDLCRALAQFSGPLRLWIAYFTEIQRAVQTAVIPELRITILRRMMMRMAERIAQRERAVAVVTGESIGQVASQTLESLATIEAAADLPILRPVIGLDKTEITARAREIGTYELSILPYDDCCSLFVPAHPRTHPTRREAEAAEAPLPIGDLLAEAMARSEVVEISAGQTPTLTARAVS